MNPTLEQRIASRLRVLLAELPNGADIPDSESLEYVLTGLTYFVPTVLKEIHPECRWMALDDISPARVRKTGDREFECFGMCCFVQDQTITPLHLRLRVAETVDGFDRCELKLGEAGPAGMVRKPWESLYRLLPTLEDREASITWTYKVRFGM